MVANRIHEYRRKTNMSQSALSSSFLNNIGHTVVSLVENGHVLPTRDMLRQLCKAFDCSPDDLYSMSDLDLLGHGGLTSDDNETATITVTPAMRMALKELGYNDVYEWMRESERMLVRNMHIQRMNQSVVLTIDAPPISQTGIKKPEVIVDQERGE